MGGRKISYAEYKERLDPFKIKGNAVGSLWNSLARHFEGFISRGNGELADCTLLVDKLLALSEGQVKKLDRVGTAQVEVFRILQKSLLQNPGELRDYKRDISKAGLLSFASGISRGRVSIAWRGLCETLGREPSTTYDIENFCVQVRDRQYPTDFRINEHELVKSWLRYLKKSG